MTHILFTFIGGVGMETVSNISAANSKIQDLYKGCVNKYAQLPSLIRDYITKDGIGLTIDVEANTFKSVVLRGIIDNCNDRPQDKLGLYNSDTNKLLFFKDNKELIKYMCEILDLDDVDNLVRLKNIIYLMETHKTKMDIALNGCGFIIYHRDIKNNR